ncbi:hypothetical protein Bca4012_017224 [Brassica carinata]
MVDMDFTIDWPTHYPLNCKARTLDWGFDKGLRGDTTESRYIPVKMLTKLNATAMDVRASGSTWRSISKSEAKDTDSKQVRTKENVKQMEEWRTEGFAVVKCSSSPHKNFRDAMVEIILNNGINHQENLKEVSFVISDSTPTNIMT